VCCVHIHPCCAGPTCTIIIITDVHSTIFEHSVPFSDGLHSHDASTMHLRQLEVNFYGKICLPQRNQITPQTYQLDEVSDIIVVAQ
jgi:hypothetical protein